MQCVPRALTEAVGCLLVSLSPTPLLFLFLCGKKSSCVLPQLPTAAAAAAAAAAGGMSAMAADERRRRLKMKKLERLEEKKKKL